MIFFAKGVFFLLTSPLMGDPHGFFKINNYENDHINVIAVSTGFYIDWPRFMYVAFLYHNKQFHPFDYLAKLTNYYMKEKSISFSWSINEFWSCHKKYGFIDKLSKITLSKALKNHYQFKIKY